jgi:MFS family permease
MSSKRSLRGLDWLNFFVANAQTGFGPFIAVYLTEHRWTQAEIGFALSVGTVATMLSQIPAGAVVDAMARKRQAAAIGIMAIGVSALLFALWPETLPVLVAEVLHGFASCMLQPAIAAITLALVVPAALGERLGRNARWGSVGNGIAAAAMGACGRYLSTRAVFLVTAILVVPALLALRLIHPPAPGTDAEQGEMVQPGRPTMSPWRLFGDRRLLTFGLCVVLFHLANAALLPLVASGVTARNGDNASLVIAACIVVPQLVVAMTSPWIGRMADRRGHRMVLVMGFLALPLRAVLFALIGNPFIIIVVQALDGVSASVFGVMAPQIAADIAGRSGRFNLCMGVIGLAAGTGATISTSLGGSLSDDYSDAIAFLALAAAGLCAVLAVSLAMPETSPARRPQAEAEPRLEGRRIAPSTSER